MRGTGDQNAIPGLINPVHGQQDFLRTGGGSKNGSGSILNDNSNHVIYTSYSLR